MGCLRNPTITTIDQREHLSSWQGSIGSNLHLIQALTRSLCYLGGLGAVAFIHLYFGAIAIGWELSPLPLADVPGNLTS